MPTTPVLSQPETVYSQTKGETFQICWATEASQQALECYQHCQKERIRNPFSLQEIIRMLRLSRREIPVPTAQNPYLTLFAARRYGKVYEIFANLFPAPASGSLPRCEVIFFQESADALLISQVP